MWRCGGHEESGQIMKAMNNPKADYSLLTLKSYVS